MQVHLEEAHAAIIREKEAAKIAIEQAQPVVKEVPVVDNAKMDLLQNQNEELEVTVSNLYFASFITIAPMCARFISLFFWIFSCYFCEFRIISLWLIPLVFFSPQIFVSYYWYLLIRFYRNLRKSL